MQPYPFLLFIRFLSVGAYSSSQGLDSIRKNVSNFIAARDGHYADPDNIFLTDGASSGAAKILELLIRNANDAVCIDFPLSSILTALQ